MPEPLVKICGVTRPEDARAAAEAGASYVGAVLVPSSPRAVDAETARRVRGDLDVTLVLVSADRSPDVLARDAAVAGAGVLQLHGQEGPEVLAELRERGDWDLWKAVRARSGDDAETALARYGDVADALLVDGWDPERLGGAGATFPWAEVAGIRRRFGSDLGFVAAGGLTPENVGRVVALLDPDVVDVSSGVEASPGVKDRDRIRAFVRAARGVGAPSWGDA